MAVPPQHSILLVGRPTPLQPGLREQLREGFPGFTLLEAASEKALRDTLAAQRPSLLLCDLSSPVLGLADIGRLLVEARLTARMVALADPSAKTDVVQVMAQGARDLVSLKDPLHLQLVVARELDMLGDWCAANAQRMQKRAEQEAVAHFVNEEVTWCTDSFARLLGRSSPAQVARRAFWACIDGEDHHALKRALAHCARGSTVTAQIRVRAVAPDGRRFRLALSLNAEQGTDGTFVKVKADEAPVSKSPDRMGETGTHINVNTLKRLRAAVAGNRLALAVQPISTLAGAKGGAVPHMLDVLVRIKDDAGEMIAGEFMREASAAGLLKPMDHWIVRNTCAIHARNAANKHEVMYFLRFSRQTLQDTASLKVVREALAQYAMKPSSLSFELTETEFAKLSADEMKVLLALKSDGCRLTLSQFGSRPESIDSLQTLPLDFVKLDIKLTADVARSEPARERLREILVQAATRNIYTISTRVSDATSLAELWKMGINFVQGYYVHEPEIVVGT